MTTSMDPICFNIKDIAHIAVFGNGMLPLYRHGDQLIASREASAKPGDRVVVRMKNQSVIGGTLLSKQPETVAVCVGGLAKKACVLKVQEIDFMARVIWASQ